MILTRDALGWALKAVCMRHHRFITRAAKIIGLDAAELARAWSNDPKHRMGVDRLLSAFDKLGYEVHFEIRKKGATHDASTQRLPTSEDQGVSI